MQSQNTKHNIITTAKNCSIFIAFLLCGKLMHHLWMRFNAKAAMTTTIGEASAAPNKVFTDDVIP
jgi:hypothetical protein